MRDRITHGEGSSVSSQVAEIIRAQIESGKLRPGERLPAERELAEELGVARSVVREGLRELRAQGYLLAGRGRQPSSIASLTDIEIGSPFAQLLQADTARFLDLIEMRRGLEVQAAALAARRRQPDDIAALEEITAQMSRAMASRDESVRLDASFHAAVARAAHNVFYVHITAELVNLLQDHIPGIRDALYTNPSSAQDLVEQHREIAAAISAGDEVLARGAMADHLTYVAQGLEHLRQGKLAEPSEEAGREGNGGVARVPGRDFVD